MSRTVLVVAGEVSGDMHAAGLVRALRQQDDELEFFGIGGDQLEAAGVELIRHVSEMAVFGLPEVLKRYRFFKGVFNQMVRLARDRRPDLVLLVDYGGFNLRFAERVRAMGLKVVYYVCPQVWASRKSRIQRMARSVDRLLVIFPFEPSVFEGSGLRVDFVGHPLVDEAKRARSGPLKELPLTGDPDIALLPGSRRQEISRILPVMCSAARRLEERHPGAAFLVASPPGRTADVIREQLADLSVRPARIAVVVGETRQVLRQSQAAMVTSGTATVEAALMGCPMLVVYITSWPIYFLAKMLIRVSSIGMVNLVAGRVVCPEFIQSEATAPALAGALEPLLGDTSERRAMVEGLNDVAAALGQGGASEHAARFVLEELEPNRK